MIDQTDRQSPVYNRIKSIADGVIVGSPIYSYHRIKKYC